MILIQHQDRYIVTQLLNTWVVRDKELLKRRKRSVVAEFLTKEEANDFCGKLNQEHQRTHNEAAL